MKTNALEKELRSLHFRLEDAMREQREKRPDSTAESMSIFATSYVGVSTALILLKIERAWRRAVFARWRRFEFGPHTGLFKFMNGNIGHLYEAGSGYKKRTPFVASSDSIRPLTRKDRVVIKKIERLK